MANFQALPDVCAQPVKHRERPDAYSELLRLHRERAVILHSAAAFPTAGRDYGSKFIALEPDWQERHGHRRVKRSPLGKL